MEIYALMIATDGVTRKSHESIDYTRNEFKSELVLIITFATSGSVGCETFDILLSHVDRQNAIRASSVWPKLDKAYALRK